MLEFLVWIAAIGLALLIGGAVVAAEFAHIIEIGKQIDKKKKKK